MSKELVYCLHCGSVMCEGASAYQLKKGFIKNGKFRRKKTEEPIPLHTGDCAVHFINIERMKEEVKK